LTGIGFYELIHPDDREMFRQRVEAAGRQDTIAPAAEVRFLRLDGGSFYAESSEASIDFNGGRAVQVVFRDTTNKKRMVEQWKTITSELSRSQKIAHMGSWEYRLPELQATWSDEAFRLLGLEPGENTLDFETWLGFIHPDDRDRVMGFMMSAHEDVKHYKTDFRIVTRTGQTKHVHMEWEAEFDERGNPHKVFGISQDVTELRKTEAELKEARAQAELYLDLMSHDINNMNHVALGYLEYALHVINAGKTIGRENKAYLEKPFKSLKSNSRLIENVTKIRMERSGALKQEVIDIGSMLECVRDELAGVNGREIAIGLTCECACQVQANELLKDVFMNLVGNAIKHSDPGKPLHIDIAAGARTENGRKYCLVTVADDGPGIPDDVKKELKDRLAKDKPQSIGKGFGLYLARMLIKDYEGSLSLEDRVPGDYSQGTRFIVWLPAAD
jgi:PAS domain S-box-containing protein